MKFRGRKTKFRLSIRIFRSSGGGLPVFPIGRLEEEGVRVGYTPAHVYLNKHH